MAGNSQLGPSEQLERDSNTDSPTKITQVNFNLMAMICGRWLPIEVPNHQFNLPSVPVEYRPFHATSFRRFARAATAIRLGLIQSGFPR